MSELLFSIITINRNNEDGLRKTMQSVLSQDFSDYEYIIIDGASTDKSVAIIHEFLAVPEYAAKISYWVSERDGGIYPAMNKGISHACGKYCLLLNSGDYLIDNEILSKASCENLQEDIIYFDAVFVKKDCKRYVAYPDQIDASYFYRGSTLSHQNTLIATKLQKSVLYTQNYKYAADIEFFMTVLLQKNCTARHIKYALAYFDEEFGISSVAETARERAEEWTRLRNQFFAPRYKAGFETLCLLERELDEFEHGYKGLLLKIRNFLRIIKKIVKRK